MARGLLPISCVCLLLCLSAMNVSTEPSNYETLSSQTLNCCSLPGEHGHQGNQQNLYGTNFDAVSQNMLMSKKRISDDSKCKHSKDHAASCDGMESESERAHTQITPSNSHNVNNHCTQTIFDPSQYQLVLYEPTSRILPMFHEKRRKFEFSGKKWTILQQWDDIGVASVVWEAALLLSQYLETLEPSILVGKRVIELGAGTGLVGMVASSLGAENVVVTDKTPGPAKANLKLNMHNLHDRSISVSKLEWGSNISDYEPPFDVILAADVIYIEETYPLLIKTLTELSSTDTVIYFSCKRRYDRDDRFFKLLHETGVFSSEVVEVWSEVQDVKVYRIHKLQ